MDINKIFAKYFIPSNDTLNENHKECMKCGGQCCKSMGCHIAPSDLKEISTKSLIDLIDESRSVSIDWYEGNPIDGEPGEYYYLRMRNATGQIVDPSWGGQCCLLKDNGCPILFQYRPKGARALIPIPDDICDAQYTKIQCAIDWLPYQDIMKEVCEHYRSQMEEKLKEDNFFTALRAFALWENNTHE